MTADELVAMAVASRATDVVLNPGNAAGSLLLKANFESLYSEPLSPAELTLLDRQLRLWAGMPDEAAPLAPQVGSFEYGPVRLRLTRLQTGRGPLVRLRLQMPGVLEEARQKFRQGLYGGTGVLPFLALTPGVLAVSGPASAGKTSALAHLLAELPEHQVPLVISEASELPGRGRCLNPARVGGFASLLSLVRQDPAETVAIDEMDEVDKLALARELGGKTRVFVTLTAPNLAAALRRLVAAGVAADDLVGVLRVTWSDQELPRHPVYRWFPLGDGGARLCPVCGAPRADTGDCRCCGMPPVRRYLDRAVLARMNSPEGYRALDRLEEEWGE